MVYVIKAYADAEYGLKERTATINASSYEEAKKRAWDMFPEYHQIGVWERQ